MKLLGLFRYNNDCHLASVQVQFPIDFPIALLN
jgi:hypothetical protein